MKRNGKEYKKPTVEVVDEKKINEMLAENGFADFSSESVGVRTDENGKVDGLNKSIKYDTDNGLYEHVQGEKHKADKENISKTKGDEDNSR